MYQVPHPDPPSRQTHFLQNCFAASCSFPSPVRIKVKIKMIASIAGDRNQMFQLMYACGPWPKTSFSWTNQTANKRRRRRKPLKICLKFTYLCRAQPGQNSAGVFSNIFEENFPIRCLGITWIRNSSCSSYSLRDTRTDLRLPMKRSANGQRCFSYRGAKLWNSLSAESKQATSLYSFKKTI